jgi:hypothetical protein
MASEPPSIFISYNRADHDRTEWIAGVLKPNPVPFTLPCRISLPAFS